MRRDLAVLAVAAAARPEQQHGGQGDPAAHRVHDHRSGEVMELLAGGGLQPGLETERMFGIPDDAFE